MNESAPDAAIATVARPILSVMVPTYRPGDHLCAALRSAQEALARASVSYHVELVDDASPDVNVADLLAEWVSAGKIQPVAVHRRPQNGGLGQCWNTCVERALGDYVHILHQDDLVLPNFYLRIVEAGENFPQAGMLFSRTIFLEGDRERLDILESPNAGILADWLRTICTGQRLQCPSVVVRRFAYRELGGFETDLRYVIDWEMWIRIAAFMPVAYIPEALAVYRIHAAAETARIKAAGIATQDMAHGLRRIKRTLRRAHRMDCYRAAVDFGIAASGFAAYDAERAAQWHVVAKELWMGLRYFGSAMTPVLILKYFRAYVRACFKSWHEQAATEV